MEIHGGFEWDVQSGLRLRALRETAKRTWVGWLVAVMSPRSYYGATSYYAMPSEPCSFNLDWNFPLEMGTSRIPK